MLKNSCPDYNILAAYLDNYLTQEECEEIKIHMESCRACASTISELNSLLQAEPLLVPDDIIMQAMNINMLVKPSFDVYKFFDYCRTILFSYNYKFAIAFLLIFIAVVAFFMGFNIYTYSYNHRCLYDKILLKYYANTFFL